MSFSINTNIASLQAQNYLRVSSAFQTKTINEVTSGLRIVNSGDDAAGLAVANSYRSDSAVLTQGIQNANEGLSQLQIADGGLSNISQLLDRARTLATESASGTFTGDRSVLNNEYQSVLTEINRQAQAIGLNTGGTFAKNLSVFIGGGQGTTAADVISNGSVSVNLGSATVDTQSLGLQGFTAGYQVASGAADSGLYNLASSSTTSVSAILGAQSNPATTSFSISGPGFSGGAGGAVTVNVNLANVADTASLVNAINAGIQSAAQQGSPQAAAFKAANIEAIVHTGTDGHRQLLFTSASTAFDVTAGDQTANGLMGNLGTNANGSATNATSTPEAVAASSEFIAGGTEQTAGAVFTTMLHSTVAGTQDKQVLTFVANNSDGTPQTLKVTLDSGTTADLAMSGAIASINQQLQASGNSALQNITAFSDGGASGVGKIYFASNSPTAFSVTIGSENGTGTPSYDLTGMAGYNTIVQSSTVGVGQTSDISTQAGAESAVTQLAVSVADLGNAQAAVGKGENQFNYAINLAQSQLTNFTTAESSIRDADLAAEAANLTKAQILMQAGVAALAQANAAPQAVLSLLKG